MNPIYKIKFGNHIGCLNEKIWEETESKDEFS